MYWDALVEKNPSLIRAAAALHREGRVPAERTVDCVRHLVAVGA